MKEKSEPVSGVAATTGGSEVKHTPGPWMLNGEGDDPEVIITGGPSDSYVCSVQIHQTPRSMGMWMEDERRANAEFIARAPETARELAALKALLREWKGRLSLDPRETETYDRITAALGEKTA